MTNISEDKPRWLRDLARFLPLKSQFVLTGNIRDLVAYEVMPGQMAPLPLLTAFASDLIGQGFAHVITYDPANGFTLADPLHGPTGDADVVLRELGLTPTDGRAAAGLDLLGSTLDRFVNLEGAPIALVIDYASRLIVRNEFLQPQEHQLFTRAQVLSHTAQSRPWGEQRTPFYNTIVWLADKEGDLPDWYLLSNPKVRHIPVAKPDANARRSLAASLLENMPGGSSMPPGNLRTATDAFVDETEAMLLLDLHAVAELGRSEGVPVERISDAVRRYKVGVADDPWKKIDRRKVENADEFVRQKVKGQDHAVVHMLDIVRRAITGVGGSGRSGRPRGVAFLAGPTGVGKTELAKTVTDLLFGDPGAYIRFDMSEFGAEHSDQRLIGAPPGYIGYDMGGELTNAIRERPFSVVLFDEIEKAHPRILDKFLQILDDGVLTSGRGDRVYFSEALIVFTSNLGIYHDNAAGERVATVTPDDDFKTVSTEVRAQIDRHFKVELNRPEILNRIGENIIVFDFIRREIGEQIFDQLVDETLADLASTGSNVTLSAAARAGLATLCLADLSNGGRGIRNQIERHLINPLARALFQLERSSHIDLTIVDVTPGPTTSLTLES